MNARLIKAWHDLQGSYYFIPSLMAIGAVLLAFISIYIDQEYGYELSTKLGLFYADTAKGSEAILTTIAGSMMTVAAVVFSITMVAVTSAAGQYGPRLIGNFMRDRGNQITLGTFTSTFIYCLLILHAARTGQSAYEGSTEAFLPNFSLVIAMIMTLFSVAVMIYFIHHVPETLNVSNITAKVGRRLRRDVEDLFPSEANESSIVEPNMPDLSEREGYEVCAKAEGYIQTVNEDGLFELAKKQDVIIRFDARPGDFVTRGDTLMRVWGLNLQGGEVDKDIVAEFRNGYAMGQGRTANQNVLFLADELVEILARALSPGVNDPFTAINCIHWYKSALKAFMRYPMPSPYRFDAAETLRVIAMPVSFQKFVSVLCDQSRAYIASDRNTTLKMLTVLSELIQSTENLEYRQVLKDQLLKLEAASKLSIASGPDRLDLDAAFQKKI